MVKTIPVQMQLLLYIAQSFRWTVRRGYIAPVFMFILLAVPWWFKELGNILIAMNIIVPKGLDGAFVGICAASG